jgi:hypothetical protein
MITQTAERARFCKPKLAIVAASVQRIPQYIYHTNHPMQDQSKLTFSDILTRVYEFPNLLRAAYGLAIRAPQEAEGRITVATGGTPSGPALEMWGSTCSLGGRGWLGPHWARLKPTGYYKC